MKIKYLFKISLAIIITLFVVRFLNSSVFIAETPQIRPDVGSVVTMSFSKLFDSVTVPLAQLFNHRSAQQIEQQFAAIPFKKTATGVYAKEMGNQTYIVVKGEEITWHEYTTTVNGKQVTVKIADGDTPPSQTDLERFIK